MKSTPRRWSLAVMGLGAVLALGSSVGRAQAHQASSSQDSALGATKVEGDQYLVQVEPPSLRSGETGALSVSIEGKAGFKFNRDFPTKLELGAAPEGLEFPQPVLKRADGALDGAGKVFTFKAPIVAKRAGEFAFDATLKFSVCNEDKCVVQRQTLRTALSVH
jgi:hypothetical protein